MEYLHELSFRLIDFLQTFSPTLDGLMSAISFFGRTEFYLIFIPYIYWAVDSRMGIRALLVLVSADFTNSVVKLAFHQPRPYWLKEVQGLSEETTYGVPSGHASDSLAFWGYLAYWLKRRGITFLVAILVLLVGLSRLYLGMHFIHDVLIGWLVGAIVLWMFIKLEPACSAWFRRKELVPQILIAFAISVGMIVVGKVLSWSLAGTTDPLAWSEFAALARSTNYSFSLSGIFFGGLAGYSLMKARSNFNVRGSTGQRIGRYALGIVAVVLIFFGLDKLFSQITSDETTLGNLLRFSRYAIVGLWVTFLAPWVFLRFGLAKPATKKRK